LKTRRPVDSPAHSPEQARGIDPTGLVGHARGETELDGTVLLIKRIHVAYSRVDVPPDKRAAAERALADHAQGCPVARSIEAAISVATSWA
jgi:organic hydroperoxide reductase OsmC/OhrA